MDELLNNANVNYLFPMHLWDKLETIQKYKDETDNKNLSVNIMDIKKQGQNWSLEL